MASFVYEKAFAKFFKKLLDLQEAGDDIRVALVMTNTTADTETEAENIGAFTTLDEMDATGYARQALANQAVNEDLANDRAEFDADDRLFSMTSAGTRAVEGAIIYKEGPTDADREVITFIDFNPDVVGGGDITIQWNAEGILQAA